MPDRGGARVGHVAGLVHPVGGEPHLEARVARRLHQQEQIAAPVAGDHGIGSGLLDLGHVGGEVLDLVDVVNHVADHGVAAERGVLLHQPLHVVAPAVVLADHVHLLAERVGVLHRGQHRAQPDLRVAVPAEVIEVAPGAGELHRLRADVEVDDLLARVAQVVLAHVVGDLPADGGGGALDDDVRAVVDGGLHLVRRLGGAALVVVLQDLDAVGPGLLVVELDEPVVDRGQEHLADRGLPARQRLDDGDLDRLRLRGARQQPATAVKAVAIVLLGIASLQILFHWADASKHISCGGTWLVGLFIARGFFYFSSRNY